MDAKTLEFLSIQNQRLREEIAGLKSEYENVCEEKEAVFKLDRSNHWFKRTPKSREAPDDGISNRLEFS